MTLDVTKEETIKEAVQQVFEKEGRIDILINNAGVGITGPIEETPEEEIKKAFETNYFGPLKMIKDVLPIMRKQQGRSYYKCYFYCGLYGITISRNLFRY